MFVFMWIQHEEPDLSKIFQDIEPQPDNREVKLLKILGIENSKEEDLNDYSYGMQPNPYNHKNIFNHAIDDNHEIEI